MSTLVSERLRLGFNKPDCEDFSLPLDGAEYPVDRENGALHGCE